MLSLENKIATDAHALPDDYDNTILALSTRLSFSSAVLTVGVNADGTPDPTDVMMFMKDDGALTSTCVSKYAARDTTLNEFQESR